MSKKATENHTTQPCPNCGYCPTCGRANTAPAYPYPRPVWVYPYWNPPYWFNGTAIGGGTISVGGNAVSDWTITSVMQ